MKSSGAAVEKIEVVTSKSPVEASSKANAMRPSVSRAASGCSGTPALHRELDADLVAERIEPLRLDESVAAAAS